MVRLQSAEPIEQPDRADRGMAAHGHLVVGNPEAQSQIDILSGGRGQDEPAFMTMRPPDPAHGVVD